MTTRRIEIDAVDAVYPVQIPANGNTSIVFTKAEGGTATAGTIAMKASAPGALAFEPIAGISAIDLAAPIVQTIQGTPADRLELTLAGFTGTANKLILTVTSWD